MKSSSGAIPGPVLQGEERPSRDARVIGFFIVLALIVVAGMLLGQEYERRQTAPATLAGEQRLAVNPELKVAYRPPVRTEASAVETLLARDAFLARNPELKVAAPAMSVRDDHAFLAQNPELSAARRYVELTGGK